MTSVNEPLLPEWKQSDSVRGGRSPSPLQMKYTDELLRLQDTCSRAAGAPGGVWLERLERPMRWLILMVFLFIVTAEWLPFFMAMRTAPSFLPTLWGISWTTVVYYRNILEAWLLGAMTLLIAIAGAHDHTQKRPPCSRTAANVIVHGINIVPLLIVIPWWGGLVGWKTVRAGEGLTELADGLGYISGKCCLYDMGLCLLPIARQSLWLNAAAKGFPEGISFHRVTGWWCVVQVLLHSLTELWAMLLVGYTDEYGTETPDQKTKWHEAWTEAAVEMFPWVERRNEDTGVPELNTAGVVNFAGLVGTVAATILALFSLPRVRRTCYDIFYLVHVPAAAFFVVMGTFHDFPIMIFVVPGLVSYFLDRTDFVGRTGASKYYRARATARVLSAEWIRLDVLNGDPLSSEASLGTQWAYLRVPSLGTNEWHAFSLADHSASFIIKTTGNWTKKLHVLVAEKSAAAAVTAAAAAVAPAVNNDSSSDVSTTPALLDVEFEGVYGNSSPPWGGFDQILFVGGGVGVTPWLPIMTSSEPQHQRQKRYLIWVGRDADELAAMSPFLPPVNTSVFLTRIPDAFRESLRSSLTEAAASPVPLILESGHDSSMHQQTIDETWKNVDMETPGHERSVSTTAPLLPVAAAAVARHSNRPILFFSVAALSLLATKVAHYYLVELPLEEEDEGDDMGGGEADVGAGALWHYFFIMRVLPVACSLLAIVLATLLGRWVASLQSRRFPLPGAKSTAASISMAPPVEAAEVPKSAPVPAGLSAAAAEAVEFRRPDMGERIAAHIGMLKPGGSLFVCVCGPPGMVKSCREAVEAARREHCAITFGFHAEEPDW